ncbi:MAG: hypothetical protein RLZZ15_893 [Verrucomicrobiota bacterium]|jgi:predicted dehydrogenase
MDLSRVTAKPTTIGIVGCGAVAELYHAPALRALAATGRVTVAALVDPDARRRAALAKIFPGAAQFDGHEAVPTASADLVLVASPARFHAEQTIALVARGFDVLCEKPLAARVAEAEGMVAAAHASGRMLAVGLVRRHFPALREIGGFIAAGTFGALRGFAVEEGGPFNWPAATPSFFDPKQAGGGVLLDAGVHVLDVLAWWCGDPTDVRYADDAAGGLEANCRLALGYGGVRGTVRLSRDWKTGNRWTLEFERATVVWRAGEANRLEVRAAGSPQWLVAQLETDLAGARVPADTLSQAFTRQLLDAVDSAARKTAPAVSGAEALRSLRLIERCYRERAPLTPEDAR